MQEQNEIDPIGQVPPLPELEPYTFAYHLMQDHLQRQAQADMSDNIRTRTIGMDMNGEITTGSIGSIEPIQNVPTTSQAEQHFQTRQNSRAEQDLRDAERRREQERQDAIRRLSELNSNLGVDEQPYDYLCEHCRNRGVRDGEALGTIDGLVCNNCADSYYERCTYCEEYHLRTELSHTYNDYFVCDNCVDNYRSCDRCGALAHDDDIENREDEIEGDYSLCPNCANDTPMPTRIHTHRSYTDNILAKFCSEDFGKIIRSKRIFSTEIECQYPDEGTRDKVMQEIIDKDIGATTDGSISSNGIEIQTPKLQGKSGENTLIEISKALTENNFTTDKTCGLHIHLDGGKDFVPTRNKSINVTGDTVKRLFLFYMVFEDVIHSFLPKTRRRNQYCKPVKENYHFSDVLNCPNLEALEGVWYKVNTPERINNCKRERKNHTRYCGVNLHTLLSANHLEIRYHSGTINAYKMLEWINLHASIMDRVAEGSINLPKIEEALTLVTLKDKTTLFFDLVNLAPTSKKYFIKRQKKFVSKISHEEDALEVKNAK